MKKPYKLKPHICRFCSLYPLGDERIPPELMTYKNETPDLEGFPYPLPSKKSDYTCFARTGDIEWYGASTGLTRYDKNAERDEDVVMYFSADRDLYDNEIKAIMPDGENIWVLTATGAAYIEMKMISAEEKALLLLAESEKYVDRRGMKSQKRLEKLRELDSIFPYGHSDNDGSFTVGFSIGEIFRYATYKREKGADHPDTIEARKVATRAVEANLLLLHVHCRGDGFAARTYLCADEPVPDDGLFLRITDNKAVCLETTDSIKKNLAGKVIDASAEIPERLAKLFTDLGYSKNDLIYKADTSSDEITHHFLHFLIAHEYLACDDFELDELIKTSAKSLMAHIIDHGYELHDFTGEPTSWAKWSTRYFNTEFGWVDGALNSAQLLMYHLVTMKITGEEGRWRESYDYLVNELGYADMAMTHFDRLYQASLSGDYDFVEDIMYGDHMLATLAFWGLCVLETNEDLLKKYRYGFKAWRTSIEREHVPGYDLPYAIACPDEEIDLDRIAGWFYRTNCSRLAAGVSMVGRHDVAVRTRRNGYKEISALMPPDETFISKYDRNPVEYKNEDSGGTMCVESCYVYTFGYWLGRYYGFFE
ncbi:MAG: hypothetical protein IJE74_06520 [Clostridia bacterium]|nr:hypothetical protein [Clostridia bacterium]